MLNFRIIGNDSNTVAGSVRMFEKPQWDILSGVMQNRIFHAADNKRMMGILTIHPRKQATVAISNQAIKFCGEEFTTVGIPTTN